MSMFRKPALSLTLLMALFMAGCGYVFQLPSSDALRTPPAMTNDPAAIFCEEHDGRLDMRQYPDQSWYGVCLFADASECEITAFREGRCQPGRQKIAHPIPPDTLITLERTVCLTPCPVYRLHIDARGLVTYEGVVNVRIEGVQHDQISQDDLWRLLEAFRQARYFYMFDSYSGGATCGTNVYTSLTINGRTKKIKRYTGSVSPPELVELEMLIDEIANSSQWIE